MNEAGAGTTRGQDGSGAGGWKLATAATGARIPMLQVQLGRGVLRERPIARFFELRRAGTPSARGAYASQGLDLDRRRGRGLAPQRVLEQADAWVQDSGMETAPGEISVTPRRCRPEIREPQRGAGETAY